MFLRIFYIVILDKAAVAETVASFGFAARPWDSLLSLIRHLSPSGRQFYARSLFRCKFSRQRSNLKSAPVRFINFV